MRSIILTKEETITVSAANATRLKAARMVCADVWNDCVALAKEHRIANEGKWISRSELEKATKGGKYNLHSQSIQAVVSDYTESRDAIRTKRKNGENKAHFPWKEKKYRTVEFKQTAIRKTANNTIQLTLAKGQRFDTGILWANSIGVVRLKWLWNRYVIQYTVEVPVPEPPCPEEVRLGGCDIGEIHPAAICNPTGASVIVSGRALRSARQFRNKALAELCRKRSRCKKGSRQRKKLGRQITRVCLKADNTCKDALHKATRKAVDAAGALGINTMVIGDPKGLAGKTKRDKRRNRKSLQKIGQMETVTIMSFLKYKNTLAGITTVFTEESGTTSDCPVCGSKNPCKGRIYHCKGCGFIAHRDGKASFMMMRKVQPEMLLPEKFTVTFQRALPNYRTDEMSVRRRS